MNKTRLLFIITKSVWAGAGKYVFDLATNLPKEEFEIAMSMGGKELLWQKLEQEKIKLYQIPHFQRNIAFFSDVFSFFEILSVLREFKPDIIQVNSSKAGGVTGLAFWFYKIGNRQLSNVKCFFTAHGWAFAENRPRWQIFLIKLFTKITCWFYDKIIVVSQNDYNLAVENKIAPSDKLIVIHNGVKPVSFLSRDEAQKKLLNKTSPLVIGAIAEWTKNKGLIYLFEALDKIKEKKIDVVLIGSGENPDKELMRKAVKKYGFGNVYLHEFIPEAVSYLKAFDIFVLPSIKEGLPSVLLEAGLAAVAVVAAKVGGIPEIIEDRKTGLLVEPKNPEAIAEALGNLINDEKLRKEFGLNLHKKIMEEFGFEKMLKNTKEILLS